MIKHSYACFKINSTSCFFTGSDEYEKLVANLSKTSLLNGIKNASPIAQTSCLEGYHSVVNHFAPKMLAYYAAEIYKTMTTTPKKELKTIEDKLKKDTPEALHNMLQEKENKEEAKNKYKSRKTRVTVVCPPTCSGVYLQQNLHPTPYNCRIIKLKTSRFYLPSRHMCYNLYPLLYLSACGRH